LTLYFCTSLSPLVVGALGDDVKVGGQTEGAETSIWKKCPVITFQTFEDITGTGGRFRCRTSVISSPMCLLAKRWLELCLLQNGKQINPSDP